MFHLLIENRGALYGFSGICSLVFALVIYSLLRNARIEPARRWATPFADTFLVLALLYVFRLLIYYYFPQHEAPPSSVVNIFILLCSGLTNYLFIVSAYQLSEPTFEKRWLRRLESWVKGRPYVGSRLLWILWFVSLLGLAGPKAQLGDDLLSAFALLTMGAALYQFTPSRDRLMAWVALISSSAYAFLYIIQLPFNYFILNTFPDNTATISAMFSSTLILSSLVFKFGFFFSAHSLMFWLSEPLRGFDQLFERTNREEKEYLESDGLVRSVCEWLKTNKVRLCVKLPGIKDDQIALFHYPSATQDGPQPRIEKYSQGTSYDEVMERAATYREDHEYHSQGSTKRVSVIAEPIFFHKSVTACLEAEVNGSGSKREARIDIERIANLKTTANLISPAVQTYREMSALNKLSQELAELQITVVTYDLEIDVERIAEAVYDIASPSFIALSLDIGFWEYCSTYPKTVVNEKSLTGFSTRLDCDEAVLNGGRPYRLLRTDLSIPETQRPDEQIFGRLVLGIEKDSVRTHHPPIGTNPTCRRALSNLVSDTLLDFVRGYLNQLTDRLSVGLGRLESTAVVDWHSQVETTAKDAKLLWAVVRCHDEEGGVVGSEQHIQLVNRLETQQSERWQKKDNPSNPDRTEVTEMWLRVLRKPENGTYSIIKIPLKDSNATLWLGVGREGFGPELDYVSPWKYFLHNFCKIADAALLRSLIMEERHRLMSKLQHVVTQTMISGIVAHQVKDLAFELEHTTIAIDGLISDRELARELISDLKTTRESSEELRQFLKDFSRDKNPTCSAGKAAQRAFTLVKRSLREYKIALHPFDPSFDSEVKVPFQILSNTIAIVLNNAKDAIRDDQTKDGSIHVRFTHSADQSTLLCDISNNGPAIPDEIRQELFEAPIRSDKKESHGLGLYCSAHVLRFYGAEIMLLPKETHPRTTFRIRVPRLIN
ncbi:MAG TPA: ATP-binding protein [Pyrinomonadaceae bacterium]|nr:ATP-binding protein [Pyrinomonadaceae bacterium]